MRKLFAVQQLIDGTFGTWQTTKLFYSAAFAQAHIDRTTYSTDVRIMCVQRSRYD
jgi:hypothetical protein